MNPHYQMKQQQRGDRENKKHKKKGGLEKPLSNSRGPRSNDRQLQMGRDQQQGQKLDIPFTKNRRNKHISLTQPTYRISKMHDRRTSNTTKGHIQRNKRQNIRQIPVFPVHTKPRRITRTISLQNQTKSSTLQLGRSRRQLSKKHLHTKNGKSTDPNGPIIRRQRSSRDLALRNNKREVKKINNASVTLTHKILRDQELT